MQFKVNLSPDGGAEMVDSTHLGMPLHIFSSTTTKMHSENP